MTERLQLQQQSELQALSKSLKLKGKHVIKERQVATGDVKCQTQHSQQSQQGTGRQHQGLAWLRCVIMLVCTAHLLCKTVVRVLAPDCMDQYVATEAAPMKWFAAL